MDMQTLATRLIEAGATIEAEPDRLAIETPGLVLLLYTDGRFCLSNDVAGTAGDLSTRVFALIHEAASELRAVKAA